jgi:hypothetical protein
MKTHKITGDVHMDIDTVYDMVNYTESLVNGLVEEWQAQKLGMDTEYFEILNLQEAMKTAVYDIDKVRNWREPKRFYGPLADI